MRSNLFDVIHPLRRCRPLENLQTDTEYAGLIRSSRHQIGLADLDGLRTIAEGRSAAPCAD